MPLVDRARPGILRRMDEVQAASAPSDATEATGSTDANGARSLICPYCGTRQSPALECRSCRGRFDPWSLSATQDDMGAWFVRDSKQPHFVGYSHRAIVAAIRAKEIDRDALVRGPTTRQLWTLARRVPGLAHLFGRCFACQAPVREDAPTCESCGATPPALAERNFLGLPPIARAVAPAGARPDLSAFVEDSSILLVRVDAVAGPSPSASPSSSTAPAPQAAGPSHAHVGLAARARSLERMNRLLFGLAVLSFLGAVGLVIVLVGIRERNRIEADQRVAEAIKSMRAEFERRTPVVVPPKAELPPMPQPPGAGAGGGVAAPETPAVP
ncbi:MAG: hypothetical protein RL325_1039 [Planctomycetota bacterium]